MKKFFVVSDIHSDYTDLKYSLNKAGFNKRNKEHILIVIGDVFDRFNETVKVYNFLKSLPKYRCILIKGNHESLYFSLLDKSFPEYHDFSNGTVRTFCNIAGYNEQVLSTNFWLKQADIDKVDLWQYEGKPYEYWDDIRDKVKNHAITKWLSSKDWKDYYEVDNFIFTHSFIPIKLKQAAIDKFGINAYSFENTEYFEYDCSWRTSELWEQARWGCPWEKYMAGLFEVEETKGKTLVCGHWHTSDFFKHLKNIKNDGDIYFSKGLIGIDGGVFVDSTTKELIHPQNVLVIEDGICYNQYGCKLEELKRVPIIKTVTLK